MFRDFMNARMSRYRSPWDAYAIDRACTGIPGEVVAVGSEGVDVCTGAGVLRLRRMQLPGKRAVAASEIINAVDFGGRVFG